MNDLQKVLLAAAIAITAGWMGWVSVQLITIDKHLAYVDGGGADRQRRIEDIERRLNKLEERR